MRDAPGRQGQDAWLWHGRPPTRGALPSAAAPDRGPTGPAPLGVPGGGRARSWRRLGCLFLSLGARSCSHGVGARGRGGGGRPAGGGGRRGLRRSRVLAHWPRHPLRERRVRAGTEGSSGGERSGATANESFLISNKTQ